MNDFVLIDKTATCHTKGCENNGVPIVVKITEDGTVICGPCGEQITDLT